MTTDNNNPSSPTAERAAFEKWAAPTMALDDDDLVWMEERNCYRVFGTHLLWEGWQARAALASAPTVPAEPVAWRYRYNPRRPEWSFSAAPASQWMRDASGFEEEPLYAASPEQAARVPLTEEQIDDVLDEAHRQAFASGKTNGGMVGETWNRIAARAIERAHGIGIRSVTP